MSINKIPLRFALRTKLVLLVSLSIITVVGGCFWLVISLQQRSLNQVQDLVEDEVTTSVQDEWINETKVMSKTIADLLVQPVHTLDVFHINSIAHSIQNQAIINHIIIMDNEGRVLGHGDPGSRMLGRQLAPYRQTIPKSLHYWKTLESGEVLEILTPIRLADQSLGSLVIGYHSHDIDSDIEELNRHLADIVQGNYHKGLTDILIYGGIIVVLGIIGASLVARSLARPIQELMAVTRKISAGDFDVTLQEKAGDEFGELNRSFMLMSDEVRKREDSLNLAKQELEARVQQRTKELSRTNAQLRAEMEERRLNEEARIALEKRLQISQKMEALGTLAGGVAHDLNNILTGIIGYPQMILKQLPDDSPFRAHIETIRSSGLKASVIVQDLLTLARRGVINRAVCNLNPIISELLDSPEGLNLKSSFPNVEVEVQLESNLPNISGSLVHLAKSIMNLLSNAMEAIEGRGKVIISTSCRYIDQPIGQYDAVVKGEYAILKVRDTGIGIDEADLAKIFEPFYTKKEMGRSGSGLGMAVVWGTIKDHNGYIDVNSAIGEGTVFEVFLPVTREALSPDMVDPSLEQQSESGSVLVVDDDETQRIIADEMLSWLGYTVELVESGQEAVAAIQDKAYDLVILDMIMDTGMDGLDTYKAILKIRPGQKAMIISGYSETDRVREAQALGAGRYLKKPYQLGELAAAVKAEMAPPNPS